MRIAVQWTLDVPGAWEWYDSSDWATLPKKPDPVGGEVLDGQRGWVYSVCVQGMAFYADQYVVLHDQPTGGCTVLAWFDDPQDHTPDEFYGHAVEFVPYQPDPRFGGAYHGANLQKRVVYGGTTGLQRFASWPWPKHDMSQLPGVAADLVRHGIWVPDALADQYAAVAPPGWRAWTEGVPPDHIDAEGFVR